MKESSIDNRQCTIKGSYEDADSGTPEQAGFDAVARAHGGGHIVDGVAGRGGDGQQTLGGVGVEGKACRVELLDVVQFQEFIYLLFAQDDLLVVLVVGVFLDLLLREGLAPLYVVCHFHDLRRQLSDRVILAVSQLSELLIVYLSALFLIRASSSSCALMFSISWVSLAVRSL